MTAPIRAWAQLAAFSLLLLLITSATYASLGVVLPAMARELHWSFGDAGLGFTILAMATGVSSYVPALVIRRLGLRAALLIGMTVMAAGLLGFSLMRSLAVYFASAALCGAGFQMMALIPGTHVLAGAFRRRTLALGAYFTVGAFGHVVGPMMALGLMGVYHGQWRAYWLTQAALAAAFGAFAMLTVGGRAAPAAEPSPELPPRPARSGVHVTARDWTVREAVRTPQFYVLLAAYFIHLAVEGTVASWSVAHLTERGVSLTVAGAMLSLQGLAQIGGRAVGGPAGEIVDPRWLLVAALGALAVGCGALSIARTYPAMLIYALGSGAGFGLAALAVTVLLLNYFGRRHNLEIFSLTCLIGAVSALGPVVGGLMRDRTGGFVLTFQGLAGLILAVFAATLVMRPPNDAPRQNKAHGHV
jgi:MFS family permease